MILMGCFSYCYILILITKRMEYRFPEKISAVLFDIDGTLTYRLPGPAAEEKNRATPVAWTTNTSMFPDVPATIKTLHSAGFGLYTATTNASIVALEKLALGGLTSGNT